MWEHWKLHNVLTFSLNVFTEVSDKNIYNKERLFEPATFCVRDQDPTEEPARQVIERIFKLTPIDA